ncbi:MAG: long-chain fatty acid--CoA ligase, partial [Solirubrobacteraceae bacterium]
MTPVLEGLMQNDFPLTLNHIRRRLGAGNHGAEVVTLGGDGSNVSRASHADIARRIDDLARVLQKLGVSQGERVATFAWNNQRHFELYFAVPCIGAVLHTLNIRLFEEQITYIVNHAEDRVIFVDDSLVPTLEKLAPSFRTVEHYVVMGDGELGALPNALRYEDLLDQAGEGPFDYPELDERQAAALCYTSGTTGNPKGVLYSHRSISLHSTVALARDGTAISRSDRILAVVPMFHVNAWGLPYGAALAGADLILPDRHLQPEPLAGLIAAERPTLMGCVPTIFQGLLAYADEHPELDLSSLSNAACGGSAVPRQLMKDFEERHDVRIFQAWGMTETSPVATYSRPREREHDDAYWDERAIQGRPLPWVELRLADDDGGEVPWDGSSTGEIEVRGPWVASRYFADSSEDEKFATGWLRTGDIASVDERGNVQITDRSKDVIKSGGEWISSVELENELMAHPKVAEAAVIAMPDPKWDERPMACVVAREPVTEEELNEHLRPRVAKWWLPD